MQTKFKMMKIIKNLFYRNKISLITNRHYSTSRQDEVNTTKKYAEDNEKWILTKDIGNTGIITLNRVKALNALNLPMLLRINTLLKEWQRSKHLVVIQGVDNIFCAGGDLKMFSVYKYNTVPLKQFICAGCNTILMINNYKKPFMSIINGITMGYGAGLSMHGKYVVATENTIFAMPETSIGLIPDVGATYILPKLKGNLGFFLGLTGHRLKGIDVLHAGIATHYVPSQNLKSLMKNLTNAHNADYDEILNDHQLNNTKNIKFTLKPYMETINKCFSQPTVIDIIKSLNTDGSDWAKNVVAHLKKMSPTSLKLTHLAFKKGKKQSLLECLKMEYKLIVFCHECGDYIEGIRSVIIDKDKNPMWNPKCLEDVSDNYFDTCFLPSKEENEIQIDNS